MTIPRGLYTTAQLCADVSAGSPVELTDEQLEAIAVAAQTETLRRESNNEMKTHLVEIRQILNALSTEYSLNGLPAYHDAYRSVSILAETLGCDLITLDNLARQ